jgi:hypothetical protein
MTNQEGLRCIRPDIAKGVEAGKAELIAIAQGTMTPPGEKALQVH